MTYCDTFSSPSQVASFFDNTSKVIIRTVEFQGKLIVFWSF